MRKRAKQVEEVHERIRVAARRRFMQAYYEDVTLDEIAGDASVSVQTVLRHFGSKEGLLDSLAAKMEEAITAGRDRVLPDDPEAAARYIVEEYDEMGDAMLIVNFQEDRIEAVGRVVRRGRTYHHEWVRRIFSSFLDGLNEDTRRRMHARLVVALDVYTWKLLRRDIGLSQEEAVTAMTEMLEAVLHPQKP